MNLSKEKVDSSHETVTYIKYCVLWLIGTPNITGLTFDGQSRTLTCTSTGGPAINVTWTKDGAVITPSTAFQQTKRVGNAARGIYHNILTIAQSVAERGLYGCIVENSWGSSNRMTLLHVSENMHGSGVTSRPEYSLGILLLWLTMGNSRMAAKKERCAAPLHAVYAILAKRAGPESSPCWSQFERGVYHQPFSRYGVS